MNKIITIFAIIFTFNVYADKVEDAIDYRQSVFKLFKANMGHMGAMIKGKVEYNEKNFNYHAKQLKELNDMPWMYFIANSDMNSKAKSDIWEDSSGFKKAANSFKKATNNLDKLAKAKNSDNDAVKKAFVRVGKSCKSCHKKYKEKKNN